MVFLHYSKDEKKSRLKGNFWSKHLKIWFLSEQFFFFQFWLVLKYLELIYFLKLKRTLYFSNPSSIVSSLQEGRQTGWLAGWQSGRLARQAVGLAGKQAASRQKSDNLEYNTMERWIDGLIIPPLDGPMFILIEWE